MGHDASLSPGSPPHAPPPSAPLPYLLLDVRNKDDYDQCHIRTGTVRHYYVICRTYTCMNVHVQYAMYNAIVSLVMPFHTVYLYNIIIQCICTNHTSTCMNAHYNVHVHVHMPVYIYIYIYFN